MARWDRGVGSRRGPWAARISEGGRRRREARRGIAGGSGPAGSRLSGQQSHDEQQRSREPRLSGPAPLRGEPGFPATEPGLQVTEPGVLPIAPRLLPREPGTPARQGACPAWRPAFWHPSRGCRLGIRDWWLASPLQGQRSRQPGSHSGPFARYSRHAEKSWCRSDRELRGNSERT